MKYNIRPARTVECAMRTGLSLDDPPDVKKCGQNTAGTRARPLIHAAAKEILTRSGPTSPCSRRGKSLNFCLSLFGGIRISEDPREINDFSDPSTVFFLFNFHSKFHVNKILRLSAPLEKDRRIPHPTLMPLLLSHNEQDIANLSIGSSGGLGSVPAIVRSLLTSKDKLDLPRRPHTVDGLQRQVECLIQSIAHCFSGATKLGKTPRA